MENIQNLNMLYLYFIRKSQFPTLQKLRMTYSPWRKIWQVFTKVNLYLTLSPVLTYPDNKIIQVFIRIPYSLIAYPISFYFTVYIAAVIN